MYNIIPCDSLFKKIPEVKKKVNSLHLSLDYNEHMWFNYSY